MILALEDFFWITSKQIFEIFRRNFHSNRHNRWQWLCLLIIPRYYCVCISPFASILSVCIQFCICRQMSCVQNKESTETHLAILTCCKMRLLTSCHDRWWVMALFISSSYCVQIFTRNDMTTKPRTNIQCKIHVYVYVHDHDHDHDHMESLRFLYCRQAPKWYQNE
jgi:hypothetical protein